MVASMSVEYRRRGGKLKFDAPSQHFRRPNTGSVYENALIYESYYPMFLETYGTVQEINIP